MAIKAVTGIEVETLGDEVISEPYDLSKVRIDLKPFTIFQVMHKVKLNEIELQPDFQRQIVWDQTRQSRLIESILIRIPLPAFYLDSVNFNRWIVVDGLQRLTTLDRFCNKNELRLKNLEFLQEFEGKTFKELPRMWQQQLEETHLNLYIIHPDTPDEVRFTIFYRINTGGLVLSPQEIRHCLYHGPVTQLLKKLADARKFKLVTGDSIRTKHMDDRECILRFFAFHLTPYTQYQQSNFSRFLAQSMRTINAMDQSKLDKLHELFFDTMTKAQLVFGDYAFRKMYSLDGTKQPINKSLFEAWSVVLSKYSREQLAQHKDEIMRAFVTVMNEDSEFGRAISHSTGSVKNVHKRFSTIETMVTQVVGS
jgi:hypothetical protein